MKPLSGRPDTSKIDGSLQERHTRTTFSTLVRQLKKLFDDNKLSDITDKNLLEAEDIFSKENEKGLDEAQQEAFDNAHANASSLALRVKQGSKYRSTPEFFGDLNNFTRQINFLDTLFNDSDDNTD